MRPAKKEYEYGVDQCSVTDKALLTEFREKRSEWMDWLERDVHHNIFGQIHSMMWNDAAYRSLNEARRFASANNPTASMNGMFGELIDRGYVSTQVLDICKITDRSNSDPKKAVISLPRLLDNIRDHRHLLTRENFVSYDGLPYDYAAAHQTHIDSLTPEELGKVRWVSTEGPDAWGTSERILDPIVVAILITMCCASAISSNDRPNRSSGSIWREISSAAWPINLFRWVLSFFNIGALNQVSTVLNTSS